MPCLPMQCEDTVAEQTSIPIILLPFGMRENSSLLPKAYSGLTDKEIREVDRYVKQNTLARFGPVREVTPKLVF